MAHFMMILWKKEIIITNKYTIRDVVCFNLINIHTGTEYCIWQDEESKLYDPNLKMYSFCEAIIAMKEETENLYRKPKNKIIQWIGNIFR